MLESMFVGLIVVGATGYAAWALTPAGSRKRFALRLARSLGGPGAQGLRGRAASFLLRIASAPGGGCNDCPANTLTPAERVQPKKRGE